MTFPRQSEAETLKRLLDANGQSFAAAERILTNAASQAPTVAVAIERHIDLLTKANEGTIEAYRRIAKNHLNPTFGQLPIDAVTEDDIIRWVQKNTANKVARKTTANHMGLLSAVFKTAMRKGWCTRNPCEGVTLPNDQRPGTPTTFLTRDEYQLIRDHTPEEYQLLLDVLVGTGARFGEATALTWDDLDLDADTPTIRIDKAWRRIGSWEHEIRSPKSPTSKRTVAITKTLATALKNAPRRHEKYVFPGPAGGQLFSADFHKKAWKIALAAVGDKLRKKPRPHDLRHTHASWLLAEGVPIFVVSRRLGHASTEITTRVYGHIMPSAHQAAVEALDRVLS